MSSTLTAVRKDGKQSKNFEINTLKVFFGEILLLCMAAIFVMFARGLSDAQLKVGDEVPGQRRYS